MKLLSAVLITTVCFAFSSCKKTESATNTNTNTSQDSTFDPSKATLLKQGSFTGNMSYTVNGTVKLYEYQSKKFIYFENFSSNNGPDLKVYIATTATATQFVSLGAMKGTSGTQVYQVNNPPDFAQYNKVLIWCQQFSVLFGQSTLQ